LAWGAVALAALALLGAVSLFLFGRRPADEGPSADHSRSYREDPRLTYRGPYRNVHPDVGYVGSDACARCHAEITESYRAHPMGRSLAPAAAVAPRQAYDALHNNPFLALGLTFRVDRQGARVWHRQERRDAAGSLVYEQALEVHYVLGSGERGHSYLTERDGYVFQTPISWFSQKGIWDMSPGFGPGQLAGRPVPATCLFCHANRTTPVEGHANRYTQPVFDGLAIGCERCHGPGERHVRTQARQDIVNPRRLEPDLREAVCQQCHLEGEPRVLRRGRSPYDFRPGLPLESCWTVFLHDGEAGDERPAVNHVEQMYDSLCFRKSEGRLGCTSCHDPHEHLSSQRRVSHYRQRCLVCHKAQGCSLPEAERLRRSKEDNCSRCHMPRYEATDIAHTAVTDHRIVRRPGAGLPRATRPGTGSPLRPFFGKRRAPPEGELGRDLGIALVELSYQGKGDPPAYARRALGLLETATRECPTDVRGLQAWGEALQALRRRAEALAAYEAALSVAPGYEAALVAAAGLCQELHRNRRALDYWRRAAAANPWRPVYLRNLAMLLTAQESWGDLRPVVERWRRLDPANVEARVLGIQLLLRDGRRAEAREEFARVETLQPPNLADLQLWFERQTH
jgi:hypothetical protein